MQLRVGFIGLGIMGKPMATNLLRAGFPLWVHNRSPAPVEDLVRLGAAPASSPKDLAARTDVIITMLPDSPDVESVALGPSGIKEGARQGQLLIDMSTINPIVSRKIAAELAPLGVAMLDAPVSGGEKGAIDGTLSIMAGGDPQDFDRAMPVFSPLGKTITHIGPIGAGGFTKLANQIIVAVNLMALSEALVFGRKAGVDPTKMVQALSGGLAGSKCLDMRGEKMLNGEFAPGFKIDLHFKDLNIVHNAAATLNVPTPASALVTQLYAAMRARGKGALDHSALISLFEELAKI